MKKSTLILSFAALTFMLGFSNCKKDKNSDPEPENPSNPSGGNNAKYALVIENGAQAIEVGSTIAYKAYLVSNSGSTVSPSSISWSSNIGGISGSNFKFNSDTVGLITATAQHEGGTYSAAVPVAVLQVKSARLFEVVPSAIVVPANFDPIPLLPVYLGTGSASYSYSSDNESVASVSSAGVVTFKSAGSTKIKVTGSINGQTSITYIPVLVIGTPEVTLPVAKVALTPALGQMFRNETLQLTAKAFDGAGKDVTSTVNFTYKVVPKIEEDEEPAIPVTVNASGLVTAQSIGSAYIQVFANGIMGQSEIIVNPDTVIMVNPFYVQLGGFDPVTFMPGPTSKQFTATTYKVNRQAYKAGQANYLASIPNPSNLVWQLPVTGVPEIDDQFKVVTLSNASNSNVTATAISGKFGSTVVIANAGTVGGVATVMVMP